MNKKGVELSINLIVTLIITILLLGLSLYLLGIIGSGVESIGEDLDRRTADQIEYLIAQENQIVAVPYNVKTAQLGSYTLFGMGIRNLESTTDYSIKVTFDGAYHPDGRENTKADAAYIGTEWVQSSKDSGPISVPSSSTEYYGFNLRVDDLMSPSASTTRGDYVFNVCVYKSGGQVPSCVVEGIRTEAELLYPIGKINQVTLRVK
jgi:hypothetical protein